MQYLFIYSWMFELSKWDCQKCTVNCSLILPQFPHSCRTLAFLERKLYFPVIWRTSNYVLRCFSKYEVLPNIQCEMWLEIEGSVQLYCAMYFPEINNSWPLIQLSGLIFSEKITSWHIYHYLKRPRFSFSLINHHWSWKHKSVFLRNKERNEERKWS